MKKITQKPSKKMGKKALRILVGTTHENLQEAIIADIVDVVPVLGDYANAMRVIDAAQKGEPTRFALQTGDLIIGALPVIGFIGDLVTPTNTLIFIMRGKKLNNKVKNLGKI